MTYREFRIIVTDRNTVTGYIHNGPPIPGRMHLDSLRKLTIDVFSQWLLTNKVTERDELNVLGSHLYEALFGDSNQQIRQAFENEFKKSQERKPFVPLRLVLEFQPEAGELAQLPWEYIYYPDQGGFFIGACAELILSRHSPIVFDEDVFNQGRQDRKHLRILMVVSRPEYEEVLDEDGETTIKRKMRSIKADEVIKAIESLPSIETRILEQPTKGKLTKEVEGFQPHVLHFIGHGQYKNNKGSLALINVESEKIAEWIEDASLADYFTSYKPRLIFLHACEGAYSLSYEIFKGLALKLIERRIPTVVAMQFAVENDVANRFATRFYQSLSKGDSIDYAVQKGREELGKNSPGRQNYSNRSFGCPVVYLQRSTKEIVLVEATEALPEPIPVPSGVGKCPKCNEDVPLSAKFCWNCTRELMLCPNSMCGKIMLKNRTCIHCGFTDGAKVGAEAVSPTVAVPDSSRIR